MELHGKRVLVMGLGIHGGGLGVARFLASQGAIVTVTDLRQTDQLASSLAALEGLPISYVLGEHRPQDFAAADIVVRNPGVPHTSPFLTIAREAGAAIEMEMSLFFRLCAGPILGVTGTKGKTTTTMLLGAMLTQQFPDTVIAGNLRVSALEALPRISATTPVVLELSSFALEGLGEAGLSPQYAAITNIAPDHLDRYGSMEAYTAAKTHIWRSQQPGDTLALRLDDAVLEPMASQARSRVVWFAGENEDAPGIEPLVAWRHGHLSWRDGGQEAALCERADVRLPGAHNRVNIAAAAALAYAFGITPANIRSAVRSFTGVPNRLEPLAAFEGVRYVNDTAATAPEAAIAALASFDEPIVLIAGGSDKQLPLEGLAAAISGRARALVLLQGSATPHLQAAIEAERSRGGRLEQIAGPFDDFEQAVRQARQIAQPGDIVLLSPGCASFGMFRNEFHRGDEFRRIVAAMQRELDEHS